MTEFSHSGKNGTCFVFFFFFNYTATAEIYTLSLHDALPICVGPSVDSSGCRLGGHRGQLPDEDRKSTRLNSSHSQISYAVFCLKKNNTNNASYKLCGSIKPSSASRLAFSRH